MKKIFILLCLGVFAFGGTTFKQAKDLLLKNNLDLKMNEQNLEQAILERKATDSLFLPNVEIDFKYTKLDKEVAINKNIRLPPPLPPAIPFSLPVQKENFKKAQLKAFWPIFTGGQIWAARKAGLAKESIARSVRDKTFNDTYINFIKAYYGLVLAKAIEKVQEEREQTLSLHLKNTQKRFDEGQIAKTEVLHAKVAYSNAQTDKEDAQNNKNIASAFLENLIEEKVDPMEDLKSLNLPKGLTQSQEHPAIIKIEALNEAASAQKLASYGKFMPVVYLFGQKELIEDDLTALEPKWAVGVGAKLNLFSRDANFRKLQQAKLASLKARLAKTQTTKTLKMAQKIKQEEFLKFTNKEKSLQTTLDFAKEALRSQQKAYEAGFATSFDVVDAQLSVSKVKVAILKTRYDEAMALAALLQTYGCLDRFERYINE